MDPHAGDAAKHRAGRAGLLRYTLLKLTLALSSNRDAQAGMDLRPRIRLEGPDRLRRRPCAQADAGHRQWAPTPRQDIPAGLPSPGDRWLLLRGRRSR